LRWRLHQASLKKSALQVSTKSQRQKSAPKGSSKSQHVFGNKKTFQRFLLATRKKMSALNRQRFQKSALSCNKRFSKVSIIAIVHGKLSALLK